MVVLPKNFKFRFRYRRCGMTALWKLVIEQTFQCLFHLLCVVLHGFLMKEPLTISAGCRKGWVILYLYVNGPEIILIRLSRIMNTILKLSKTKTKASMLWIKWILIICFRLLAVVGLVAVGWVSLAANCIIWLWMAILFFYLQNPC